jgi:hypothetical protein
MGRFRARLEGKLATGVLTTSILLWVMAVAVQGLAAADGPAPTRVEHARRAHVGPPVHEEPVWLDRLPQLTSQERQRREQCSELFNLPGPGPGVEGLESVSRSVVASPGPETESVFVRRNNNDPILPESARVLRNVSFSEKIPDGMKSNVMESSVAVAGAYAFFTGNWFAARSIHGGSTWTYIDDRTGFPESCCDQTTIYDSARDRLFWMRLGDPATNPDTGNYENVFKLGVSGNGGKSFWLYTIRPTDINPDWQNQFLDYPHMQLGADYLYIAVNLFDKSSKWVQTVMLRWSLDQLAAAAPGFDSCYYSSSEWFTFVAAQGAQHTMYWASNWPSTNPKNNRLGIWRWDEESCAVLFYERTVPAWAFTTRGGAHCGASSGNWAARYDQRVLAGARYEVQPPVDGVGGKKILGWWGNVKEGGGFPFPYVEAAAFYEDTLELVPGASGRPLVWSSSTCFAYPSVAANKRGDLGMVLNYGTGEDLNPSVAFAMADDFVSPPPGWLYYRARISNARPLDNKWGDYNTVREFEPTEKVWVAASHFLPTTDGACCSAAAPVYFVFGRGRDADSWARWQDK